MEHKDKIPEEVKADVQKAIDELKAVMESEDAEDIKEKVQALQVRSRTCTYLGVRCVFAGGVRCLAPVHTTPSGFMVMF